MPKIKFTHSQDTPDNKTIKGWKSGEVREVSDNTAANLTSWWPTSFSIVEDKREEKAVKAPVEDKSVKQPEANKGFLGRKK